MQNQNQSKTLDGLMSGRMGVNLTRPSESAQASQLRSTSVSPKPRSLPSSGGSSRRGLLKSRSSKVVNTETSCKSSPKERVRSASAGRSRDDDLRARYWAFLFDNLHRAVDEIYQNCETDESIAECKEALMVLDNYNREFTALIAWLKLTRDFEATPPPLRPTSLAWEVRKSIPATQMVMWNKFFCSGRGKDGKGDINESMIEVKDSEMKEKQSKVNESSIREESSSSCENEVQAKSVKESEIVEETKQINGASSENTVGDKDIDEDKIKDNQQIKDKSIQDDKKQQETSVKTIEINLEDSKEVITNDNEENEKEKKVEAEKIEDIPLPKKIENEVKTTSNSTLIAATKPITKTAASIVANGKQNSNNIVSKPKLTATAPVSVINKNFTKETNASRAKRTTVSNENKLQKNFKSESNLNQSNQRNVEVKMRNNINSNCNQQTSKREPMSSRRNLNEIQVNATSGLTTTLLANKSTLNPNARSFNPTKSVENLSTIKLPSTTSVATTITTLKQTQPQRLLKTNPTTNSTSNTSKTAQKPSSTLVKSKTTSRSVSSLHLLTESRRESISKSISKSSKKVKDEDGWELVRGRQRSKSSLTPPKVIIVEDEGIKTTPDGTVVAAVQVTAAQQTQTCDEWADYDLRMCATWPNDDAHESGSSSVMRPPGRACQMHEKLSSPSRKRSISESIKRHQEKCAKAREVREKLLEEKKGKFKDIMTKVEEMKTKKEEQALQLRMNCEQKLQRAEEKRLNRLKSIKMKAHDEESKAHEIQFINSLEAQNKKHDLMSKEKDQEARLLDIQEERQRRLEEKAAKELAAEERRKVIEGERQLRLLEMTEKRKLKENKIEQQFQEKEKERMEMAKEKARDRQERICALNTAHQANVEELQKKIIIKQEESKRRHDENMEQIRKKAFELSVKRSSNDCDGKEGDDFAPKCAPFETNKLCLLCNVIIKSEVYLCAHLRGKSHQNKIKEKNLNKPLVGEELEQFNLKHIVDHSLSSTLPTDSSDHSPEHEANQTNIISSNDQTSDKSKEKNKRKCKKIKSRLIAKGNIFEEEYLRVHADGNKDKATKIRFQSTKMSKLIKDLQSLSSDEQITGPWPSNMVHSMERCLNELEKCLTNSSLDRLSFNSPQVLGIRSLIVLLSRVLDGNKNKPTSLPDKVNSKICSLLQICCKNCHENSLYLVQSNCVLKLLDILSHRCNLLDLTLMSTSSTSTTIPSDSVIGSVCLLLSVVFTTLDSQGNQSSNDSNSCTSSSITSRLSDVIHYTVSANLVDKLSFLMSNIRGPIDDTPDLALLLSNILSWLSAMTRLVMTFNALTDPTQLVFTLQCTQLAGVVSLVYGILLHSGAPSRTSAGQTNDSSNNKLPVYTIEVVHQAIKMINMVALIDLQMVQSILGSEGLSLQLRHICSYLLWYCNNNDNQSDSSSSARSLTSNLIHEVILLIGNFTMCHKDNQCVIQSGQSPSILQQLCCLPFKYFSDEELTNILLPTLITCCFENPTNRFVLEQEMSSKMLSTFIESTIVDLLQKAANKSLHGDFKERSKVDDRWSLATRFPKNKWNQAKDYFESEMDSTLYNS